ncbi:TOPRS ligase, partial [Odontophorus gujanensis]|nr:TOPRS ligase [Odontophorus gujanensis]
RAAHGPWIVPICFKKRRHIATVIACGHEFCLGCMQRWAMLKATCPLCRTVMRTIRASARGDERYVDCIVSPPAVPVPAGFRRRSVTRPEGTVARAPSPLPQPPEQPAAEPEMGVRLGGLLLLEWAAAFRTRRSILDPVLLSLHQKLSAIHGIRRWQVVAAESFIESCLIWQGPNRDAILMHVQVCLGPMAAPIIDWLIHTIISTCGRQARRLRGIVDEEDRRAASVPQGTVTHSTAPSGGSVGPDVAEELPSTSSGLLHERAGELPAASSPEEREQPREEPGQEAAGPS